MKVPFCFSSLPDTDILCSEITAREEEYEQHRPDGDFHFRCKECWVYEYDLTDWWQHEIRLEQVIPLDLEKSYPPCLAGKRLSERSTPELLCQEIRWASLLS